MTDGFDEANLVPHYYTLPPQLNDAQLAHALWVFRLTPLAAAVVLDSYDIEQAQKLSDTVLRAPTLPAALEMAQMTGEPTVIITGEKFLAYYADSSIYEISLPKV